MQLKRPSVRVKMPPKPFFYKKISPDFNWRRVDAKVWTRSKFFITLMQHMIIELHKKVNHAEIFRNIKIFTVCSADGFR